MPLYENHNHHRWLSEVEFMLNVVEVAKTLPQIFDRLSLLSKMILVVGTLAE